MENFKIRCKCGNWYKKVTDKMDVCSDCLYERSQKSIEKLHKLNEKVSGNWNKSVSDKQDLRTSLKD